MTPATAARLALRVAPWPTPLHACAVRGQHSVVLLCCRSATPWSDLEARAAPSGGEVGRAARWWRSRCSRWLLYDVDGAALLLSTAALLLVAPLHESVHCCAEEAAASNTHWCWRAACCASCVKSCARLILLVPSVAPGKLSTKVRS